MKKHKILFSAFFALMLVCSSATDVMACACCTEEGEYSIRVHKPDDYVVSLLKNIEFAKTAKLFTGEAEPEEVTKGLLNPNDNYSLTGAFSNNLWQLNFKDGNNVGTLKLPLPVKMLNFKADIHDSEVGGTGPKLYKEWRFEGQLSGTGIFKAGIAPLTKYFLVLQGRGNICDNAEDFTHWRLEVTGKKASYAFFGKLAKQPTDVAAK